MKHLDDLAGALSGQVLERAAGVNRGRLGIEYVADTCRNALLAQGPGDLLDLLGRGQDVGGRGLGGLDNGVELLGGLAELAVILSVGLMFAISALVRAMDLAISTRSVRMRSTGSAERSSWAAGGPWVRIIASRRSMAASSIVVSA